MDIGAATIDQWHKDKGWNSIGYHYVVRRKGAIEPGRILTRVGAHAYGYNRVSWGVCLVGGVDREGTAENNFTEPQFDALRLVVDALQVRAPDAEVLGHRDLSPDINGDGVIEKWEWSKDCPCFNARHWYAQHERDTIKEDATQNGKT
jgi:N-acetyl-anhydromuramyl-L-alanine amidase AmpD